MQGASRMRAPPGGDALSAEASAAAPAMAQGRPWQTRMTGRGAAASSGRTSKWA
jgi:hypothetical protein